jgi:large subunit ribosomal protein L25
MQTVTITVKPRHLSGTDVAKKLRRANLLPAVAYGPGQQTTALALDPTAIKRAFQGPFGRNQVFAFDLSGTTKHAIAKQVQLHPFKRTLQHVDLYYVDATTPIEVTVPLVLTGRSLGQKQGGRLDQLARDVKVRCTPDTLPQSISFDVTPIDNGQSLSIDALPMPAGVSAVYKRPYRLLEVDIPKVETPVAATADAAVAEAAPAAAPVAEEKGGDKDKKGKK